MSLIFRHILICRTLINKPRLSPTIQCSTGELCRCRLPQVSLLLHATLSLAVMVLLWTPWFVYKRTVENDRSIRKWKVEFNHTTCFKFICSFHMNSEYHFWQQVKVGLHHLKRCMVCCLQHQQAYQPPCQIPQSCTILSPVLSKVRIPQSLLISIPEAFEAHNSDSL